jgi:hypothetical protein
MYLCMMLTVVIMHNIFVYLYMFTYMNTGRHTKYAEMKKISNATIISEK